jgi:N-acetylneuraminic acid mutarotase
MKKTAVLILIPFLVLTSCKKDNETDSIVTRSGMDGYIQKGPFISGSSITFNELDASLVPMGKTYNSTIINDLGAYTITNNISSPYIEIVANGKYYNEVNDSITLSPITLRSLQRVTDIESNVNILTTLAEDRIKYLVLNKSIPFGDAFEQAENEILKIFGITGNSFSHFNTMSLSGSDDSDAILIALSSIIQGRQSVTQLSEFITKFQADIKEDGTIENTDLKNIIKLNASNLNLTHIRHNLETLYQSLGLTITIPNFEKYTNHPNVLTLSTSEIKYGDTLTIYGYFNTTPGLNTVCLTNNYTNYYLTPLSVSGDSINVLIYNHEYPTQLLNLSSFKVGVKTLGNTTWCDRSVTLVSSWRRVKDFPGNARYKTTCFSLNGNIYVGGGSGNGAVFKDFWKYNPRTDTWTRMSDFPGIARNYPRSFSNSSYGYLGAGFSADNSSKVQLYDFYKYNPITDTWSVIQDYPDNISNFYVGYTINADGRVFISLSNQTTRMRELVNDVWVERQTIAEMTDCPAVGVFSIGKKYYIIVGYKINNTYSNKVWEYDSEIGQWNQKSNFPGQARYAPAFFSINNYGYYGCGISTSNQQFNDMWRYDPTNDKWIRIEDFPGGIRSHLISASPDNSGFIGLGIINSSITYLKDFWRYDPD